jgi:hypothetical protein
MKQNCGYEPKSKFDPIFTVNILDNLELSLSKKAFKSNIPYKVLSTARHTLEALTKWQLLLSASHIT